MPAISSLFVLSFGTIVHLFPRLSLTLCQTLFQHLTIVCNIPEKVFKIAALTDEESNAWTLTVSKGPDRNFVADTRN